MPQSSDDDHDKQNMNEDQNAPFDLANGIAQTKVNGQRQKDISFLRSIHGGGSDDDLRQKCDNFTRERFGIETNGGAVWTPDHQPFRTGAEYADAMQKLMLMGYRSIATDEYRAWQAASESGDRAAMIKAAGIETLKMTTAPNANDGMGNYFDPGMGLPNAMVPKTDEEIDSDIQEYGRKIAAQNFVGLYRTLTDGMDDDGKRIVKRSVLSGDGLPEEERYAFTDYALRQPEQAAKVKYLIDASRRNVPAWGRDAAHSFTQIWDRMGIWGFGEGPKHGLSRFFEEALEQPMVEREMYSLISGSADSGKYWWNDAERASYKRLVDLVPSSGGNMTADKAREYTDRIAAKRLVLESSNPERQREERKTDLMVEDAISHKPYTGYGFIRQGAIDAIGTIPYMAVTSIPGVGFVSNALGQFENQRDEIIANGGDPNEAVGLQLGLAFAWAGIEKLEYEGLVGKPLTGLQRRVGIAKIFNTAWKNGKLAKIGKLAISAEKEAIATTLSESFQEGLQGIIEEGETAWFTTHDLEKTRTAALGKGFADNFVSSLASMGILGHIGTLKKTATAMNRTLDNESIANYAIRQMQIVNAIGKTAVDAESKEAKPRRIQKLLNSALAIWDENKTDANAAMEKLQDKLNLDADTTMKIAEYFDLRENILANAARNADEQMGLRDAMIAGGAFHIGKDTTYDPADLFHIINPDIEVSEVDIPNKDLNRADEGTASDAKKAAQESREVRDLRRSVDDAQRAVEAAKVGSARRGAEKVLWKAKKKLEKAIVKAENSVIGEKPSKMATERGYNVTIPMRRADGSTVKKTFTIRHITSTPNVNTAEYAASVNQAMTEAVSAGEAKPEDVISPEQYMALTDDERIAYLKNNRLTEGGSADTARRFVVTDETGKEVFSSDGLVNVQRALSPDGLTRIGGNWTVAHETAHAVVSFARQIGAFDADGKTVDAMTRIFGDARKGVDELWNEEAMADGFAEYLRNKYDFHSLKENDAGIIRSVYDKIANAISRIFEFFNITRPETPVDVKNRSEAMDAAFEAIRSGDFRGMSVYAGIDFASDKTSKNTSDKGTDKLTDKVTDKVTDNEKTNPESKPVFQNPVEKQTKSDTPAVSKTKTNIESNYQQSEFEEAVMSKARELISELGQDPAAVKSSQPLRTGGKVTVFTPDYSMNIEAEMVWTPLADLVESTDDRSVQMRDRSRAANDQQVLTKTRKGVFQPLALFPGSKSDDGSPIIGGGNRIISGHGRKRMLDQLSKEGRFGEYISAINAEAERRGISPAPAGMKNPVLVLRVTGGLDTREDLVKFAELSNRWGGLERSGAELAESDAKKITDGLLRLYAPDSSGNILAASNRPFMAAFLKEVGATGLTNADGTPTPEAALRVNRAMMTAIFGNDDKIRSMVRSLLEKSSELSLSSLQNALMRSAGRLISMKRAKGSFDIVADVREAAYQYVAWRSAQQKNPNLTLAENLNQRDFFSGDVPPMQQALARLLDAGRFGAVLEKYNDLVAQQAVDAQATFGFFEQKTPLQIIGESERALLTDGETPVTPDPKSAKSAEPVQTAPAVSIEPEPKTANEDPIVTAQKEIAPPEPAVFIPARVVRGTATLPGPGADGIDSYLVNADGQPTTEKRRLPPGAWNLLRSPYDVNHVPAPSAQDKAGRGLGISDPQQANDSTGKYWGDIFPHFQGNKTEMADRTSQAIRKTMTKAEMDHYTTVVDYFGGGGCWGLYHALTNFKNARQLVVNEWDPGRITKIRLLQEHGAAVADEAMDFINRAGFINAWRDACKVCENGGESGSGSTIASKLVQFMKGRTGDELGLLTAVYDCANTILANSTDELTGETSFDAGLEKIINNLREDGRKAKEAADAFKARGGNIAYRQGDAASFADAPTGHQVVAICDPPYYLTTGYSTDGKNADQVPLDGAGWSYTTTLKLLHDLVDNGDAVVYTDEAWWNKKTYTPDRQTDFFSGGKSKFEREQETLIDIINTLDHFDVAGRVVKRQEVLGVHHGHDKEAGSGANADRDVNRDGKSGSEQGRISDGARSSVLRMAGGSAEEDRAILGRREDGGRSGRRAIAREVIVREISDSIGKASPESDPASIDSLVRHSIRSVREDKQLDYAKTVAKNAKTWLSRQKKHLDRTMSENGYTEKVWHGTSGPDFNSFRMGDAGHGISAAYFSYQRGTAENYAALRALDAEDGGSPNIRQFYVAPGKTLDIDESKRPMTMRDFEDTVRKASEDGYDSIRVIGAMDDQGFRLGKKETTEDIVYPEEMDENGPDRKTDILIVIDRDGHNSASRIKSADPVTFDDELPIPLEMRANPFSIDVRYSVQMGKNAKEEARKAIDKFRPDIGIKGEEELERNVDEVASFGTPKERKLALHWLCTGSVVLPEDRDKITEAMKTAERAKVDPFQFSRPGEILEQYSQFVPSAKPTDPDTVPELSDRRNMGNGIVTYLVQDDKEGQQAVRNIVNTHFGKNSNPWCIVQADSDGNLKDNAYGYWCNYSTLPKRIAFRNGKLIAFMASGINQVEWWNREDARSQGIPFTKSEGNGIVSDYEADEEGNATLKKIYRGDKKDKNGTYEEWSCLSREKDPLAYTKTQKSEGKIIFNEGHYPDGKVSFTFKRFINNDNPDLTIETSKNYDSSGKLFSIDINGRYNSIELTNEFKWDQYFLSINNSAVGMRETYKFEKNYDSEIVHTTISKYNKEELKSEYRFNGNILTRMNIDGNNVEIDNSNRLFLQIPSFESLAAEIDEIASNKKSEMVPSILNRAVLMKDVDDTTVASPSEDDAGGPSPRHSVFAGERLSWLAGIGVGKLKQAKKMLKDLGGVYTDEAKLEIWKKTGWWQGIDDKWRFEVEDIKPLKTKGKGENIIEIRVDENHIRRRNGRRCKFGRTMLKFPLSRFIKQDALFRAYPDLKKYVIAIDEDNQDECAGYCDAFRREIVLAFYNFVQNEENGDIKDVLNEDGMKALTHEIQHAVQFIEGFAEGGDYTDKDYNELAGEVEARNAERRMGGKFKALSMDGVSSDIRSMKANLAPWMTEDVPAEDQVVRFSVRRSPGVKLTDLATAFVAQRHLAGKDVSVEDADKLLKNLGAVGQNASELVVKAKELADRNRAKMRTEIDRAAPELIAHLASAGLSDKYDSALNSAITGGANAVDPAVGQQVSDAIQDNKARALAAANGFTAAEMMAELPISLADGVFAVSEYEKTPEEKERLEAAKEKREEERKKKAEELEKDGESQTEIEASKLDDPTYTEPTSEQKAAFDALMDRARFANEAREEEERRRKNESSKKAADNSEETTDGDGEGEDGGGDGGGQTLPEDTLRRIAPVFESADLFAQFIVEWTSDHIVTKHPEIQSTAEMWRNPVAVKELRETAANILRQLAKDTLGSPAINADRNYADKAINDMEGLNTFNSLRRKIAHVYDRIHDNALRRSRRNMVKELVKNINKAAIEGGRFSYVQEETKRKIDARTERWARWIIPYLTMSEAKLSEEIDSLKAIIAKHDTSDEMNGYDKTNDTHYIDAADKLAIANKYGGMIRWMPGDIETAAVEIMEQINGKREAFEKRRDEIKNADKTLRDAIIAAVEAGGTTDYRKQDGAIVRRMGQYADSLIGSLNIEMQNIIKYCKDEDKRKAATDAFNEIAIIIGRAAEKYRLTIGQANSELNAGLTAAYGNAEIGIKHLSDKLPENIAKRIFTQQRQTIPTYGQLLQLYATAIQVDYKDNADKFGRTAEIAEMEAALTPQDKILHAWAVGWYKDNRLALSSAVEAITGLPVSSPDEHYVPARMLNEPSGFSGRHEAWSPVPSALNRRIKHKLDFNEAVSFLSVMTEAAEVRAQTIGYGMAGIRLRNVLAHHDVQAAVRKNVGRREMQVVTQHVEDVLLQGIERKDSDAFFRMLNFSRRWLARFYLSGNLMSAAKQLASRPVWANVVGFKDAARYWASAGTEAGRQAIRDLMESDGFKARYTMGWSEEVQNILRNPSKHRLVRYIEKAYDKGMLINKFFDALACLWMAQGFYRDALSAQIDRGYGLSEAKERAAAITWSVCENGQQSGRIENMNQIQRKHPEISGALFQFMTAYLLQNNYEIQAAREWHHGTPGAKGRFLRAAIINHVLIPGYVELVMIAWRALMGEEPIPDDPDKLPQYLKDLIWSCAFGPAAPLYMYAQMGRSMYDKVTGYKQQYHSINSGIPAEGIIRVGGGIGTLIVDLGKGAVQEITPIDFEDEVTTDKLMTDLNQALKLTVAPYRHAEKAISNRVGK